MIEIIGKNGAGKSYLANELYNFGFKRNVGYTTRPMRDEEINGVDYYFISKKQFEEMISKEELVDYKFRNGFYYGISKKNISNSTILVSGDAKKIENITGYKILKLYIDCDFLIRYLRVLERNENTNSIFNRFHTENFSYLYDFDAIFINNNLKSKDSFEEIMSNIINNNLANNLLIPNRVFIEKEVEIFNIDEISNNDDKLLILLRYEEYLLRRLFLENKDLYAKQVIKKYYDDMLYFMTFNKIKYLVMNNELYADINDEKYKLDYKIKKKVK
ncbi:MAG: hypothetical protein ACI4OG_02280 [Bacilli bacterium]